MIDREAGIAAYGCGPDEAALFHALAPPHGAAATVIAQDLCAANAELAAGHPCVSVGHKAHVGPRTLRALADVGVSYISTRSIGANHIDLAAAERLGLRVETVAYSPDSVADFTLMLMLMVIRHARPVLRRVDAGDYRLHDVPGRELRDLTVGVVGTGRIGAAVIDRLRGFGGRVLAHDRRRTTAAEYVGLDALVERSDVVTLHTPLTAATRHLLDARRLGAMPHGAVVVNTGRGALIDTEALVAALERGRLAGAALDVLEDEQGVFYADRRGAPLDHPLLSRLHALPNVIVSPHTAYYTDHALRDTVERSIANCMAHAIGGAHV
jgi:D-specific alpha-keto acid dehydrogenase